MNYGLRHGTVHKLTSGSSSSASSAFSANIEYIKVSEGEKIAVLRVGGSDGKVSVTELTE